jgi:hypothetical protein
MKRIKVDLADGFYRVWVNASDVIKLCVAFPNLEGEDPLIAFPETSTTIMMRIYTSSFITFLSWIYRLGQSCI